MPHETPPDLPIHLAAFNDAQVTFNISDLPRPISEEVAALPAGTPVQIVVSRGPRRKTASWSFYVNRAGKTCTSYTYPIGYAMPVVGSPQSFKLLEIYYNR